jgi:hypothetical protein
VLEAKENLMPKSWSWNSLIPSLYLLNGIQVEIFLSAKWLDQALTEF